MKHVLIAAALLSLGGVAAGCGDNSDSTESASSTPTSASSSPTSAPTDGTSDDLCTALTAGSSIKDGADVADFAAGLEKAGTPTDIPTEARKGFETYVGVLEDVDPKATAKDLQNMKNVDLSKEEQTNVQAFLGYASQTCAPSAPSAPSSSN
ncbi:hypothetical protein GCM10009844_10560 [Nocardioides koreensis]|uniref:Hemophore-related protein n=1 Tax=Nocardioides koreensis TaxID=433651 RepID=A0ABP5L2H8_9ACTN